MLRGMQKDRWIHTAQLVTSIVNFSPVRDPDKLLSFEEVYPFTRRRRDGNWADAKETWTKFFKGGTDP